MPYETDEENDDDPNDIIARLREKERSMRTKWIGDTTQIEMVADLLGEAAKTIWNLRNGYGG